MPDAVHLILASALALGVTFATTPMAIAVAARTDFHDRPQGYKDHASPTPYLGGAAVLCGFLAATLTIGGELSRLSPIVGSAGLLWVLGTVDDRVTVPARLRVGIEGGLGALLWASGLGWSVFGNEALDLAFTVFWVVGLVNAFNLMDNMDGAAATVGAVTAVATASMALLVGDPALAVMCGCLAGACLGFLPYNLAGPARIFLGDGGSLPVGFVAAAAIMAMPGEEVSGLALLLAGVLLAGVPVIDTALVVVSRYRAGVSVIAGGRDHLTHRLSERLGLGSPRRVALILGAVQAVSGAVAVGVVEVAEGSAITAWSLWFLAAVASVAMLETRGWAPVREASVPGGRPRRWARVPRHLPLTAVEGMLIVFIAVACGLSPFLYGFYDTSVWGPIALFALAALLGLLLARPAAPRRRALLAAGSLAFLWLWSLASMGWAESDDQALTDANRWMLYAALLGVLVLLLRNDSLSRAVMAACSVVILALGLYLSGKMVLGQGSELFIGSRLNEPLGYVNGQAGYLLLGVWPLIALAERIESRMLAGLGAAGATLLVGLAVLSQTRAIAPAVAVSVVVLVVAVPGRSRRLWALLAVTIGVLAPLRPLLDVYGSTVNGRTPSDEVLQTAATALVAAAVSVGLVWTAVCSAWLAIQRRFQLHPAARRALAAAPAALVVIAGIVALSSITDPFGRVEREYRSFVELAGTDEGESRFTSGGGNRYDYWRIAARQFSDSPLRGVGAGNYDRTYFLERRTTEDVRQAHSIEFQVLGELGLVGAATLALFVICVLSGFARRTRAARGSTSDRALAVAAGGAFLIWLLHTSVDWLHLIPGVTGLALCSAAVLAGPWRRPMAHRLGRWAKAAVGATALLVLVGAALVGQSALAERYRGQARELLSRAPAESVRKANDSLSLNDEALATHYVKAAAYARLDRYSEARAALGEALRHEPHDFVTWVLLGDLAIRRGDARQARADYRRAARLNPRDRTLNRLAADPREALEK